MLNLSNESKVESFRQHIAQTEGDEIADAFQSLVNELKAHQQHVDPYRLLGEILEQKKPDTQSSWRAAGEMSVIASLTSGLDPDADES